MEEEENPINFFCEEIDFALENEQHVIQWLTKIAEEKEFEIENLNYIFCNDEYLHKINVEYLDHDTYTDIITFDNSEEEGILEGDIFVSIERVKENSQELKHAFTDELHRVIVHGLLHLIGYDDHSDEDEATMRSQEDQALAKRHF